MDNLNPMLQEMLPTKKGFTREEVLCLVMLYTRATFGKDSDNDSLCICSARDQNVYNTICKMIALLAVITPMYLMYSIWSVGT